MEGPFHLRIGTPGGELDGGTYDSPYDALVERDLNRNDDTRWLYEVLSRDTDPPETGEVEWCAGCGREPVLASTEYCRSCQ